jgi:hypothetical protein
MSDFRGLNEGYHLLACGKEYSGEWNKVECLRKMHMKHCITCINDKKSSKESETVLDFRANLNPNTKSLLINKRNKPKITRQELA